jgi:hypothetical protein
MTRFRAKSHCWTAYNNREWVVTPTESNIDLRPNIPVCVFVPDELDNVSLPDLSMIDRNILLPQLMMQLMILFHATCINYYTLVQILLQA